MDLRDRVVYHQAHPVKLLTDPVSGLLATVLLWRGRRWTGTAIGLLPPATASLALILRADLRPQRRSPLGRYAENVPLWTLLPRLEGYGMLLYGARRRNRVLCVAGALLAGFGLLPWRWLLKR